MPTTSRFVRGSSNFATVIGLVMGPFVGLVTSGCVLDPPDAAVGQEEQELQVAPAQMALDTVGAYDVPTAQVCSTTSGKYHCMAHVQATATGHADSHAAPAGFGAIDLQAAYKIPTSISGTPTIAIVDAYGYPELEADLGMYRTQYGLPPCTIANGCLKIVNQSGATTPLPSPPPSTDDWTLETALDVDMASAACPKCKILVVQATDNQGDGLEVGQNAAATLGATVISNSWGGPEQAGQSMTAVETYFNHPGIAIFVSAGDAGYNDGGQGPDYPGTSAYVIAVGGTRLVKDTSARGFAESAWTSGGSACSLSIPKPAYQTNTGCTYKATTDIAAVGDPQTGVAIYNSRNGGWQVIGGTSASAPFIAGVFAATGNGGQTSGEFVKNNAAKMYDVTTGQNGTCTNAILCHAGVGWDGPTGYGTPNASALVVGGGGGSGSGSGSGGGGGTGGGGGGTGDNNTGIDGDVTGGCAAGGSGAGFATVLVLGFAAIRRRRR